MKSTTTLLFQGKKKKTEFRKSIRTVTDDEINNLDIENCVESALKEAILQAEKIGLTVTHDAWATLDIPAKQFEELIQHNIEENEVETEDIMEEVSRQVPEKESFHIICEEEKSNEVHLDSMELKDFSENISDIKEDSAYIKVKIGDTSAVIKKSSYCWLLDESSGRVSTDRLKRFVTNSQNKLHHSSNSQKRPSKRLSEVPLEKSKKKKNNKISKRLEPEWEQDTSSDEDDEPLVILDDSTDTETFSNTSTDSQSHNVDLLEPKLEKYYAVLYDHQRYIGRVLEKTKEDHFRLKFLKAELECFIWPKTEDVEIVHLKYIFYGPINLVGNSPFSISRSDSMNLKKQYKLAKQRLGL